MSAERLADFVAGLPEGQRHKGFFWAAMTAVKDDTSPAGLERIVSAAVSNGLDRGYAERTIAEAREAVQRA